MTRQNRDGVQVFESLAVLCNLLMNHDMADCALITFLQNFSD